MMTHAQRFTNIFGAPLVAASTGSTTFDPTLLRSGRMTVYLITPADKMVVWASLQRLWLGACSASSRGAYRPRKTRSCSWWTNVPISARCRPWRMP